MHHSFPYDCQLGLLPGSCRLWIIVKKFTVLSDIYLFFSLQPGTMF